MFIYVYFDIYNKKCSKGRHLKHAIFECNGGGFWTHRNTICHVLFICWKLPVMTNITHGSKIHISHGHFSPMHSKYMTSFHGNPFLYYWLFERGIHWWTVDFPSQKSSNANVWFLWLLLLAWEGCWPNNQVISDLRYLKAHIYAVMTLLLSEWKNEWERASGWIMSELLWLEHSNTYIIISYTTVSWLFLNNG